LTITEIHMENIVLNFIYQ